jgi:hypothetical protein
MEDNIIECLRRAKLAIDLTQIDWELLLQDSVEEGSLCGVLTVLTKLPKYSRKQALEDLVVSAVCSGDGQTALDACKELQRSLSMGEEVMLLENMALAGNVEGFFRSVTLAPNQAEAVAFFHITIMIAVCGFMYKKRVGSLANAKIGSWHVTYKHELALFNVRGRQHVPSYRVPGALLFRDNTKNTGLL